MTTCFSPLRGEIRITDLDIERFTCGDCAILAQALHKLTGWPMYAFDDGNGGPDGHAFVVTPDDKVVDIEGVHDEATFNAKWSRWSCDGRVPTSYEAIVAEWGRVADYGRYSFARARHLAPHLARLGGWVESSPLTTEG